MIDIQGTQPAANNAYPFIAAMRRNDGYAGTLLWNPPFGRTPQQRPPRMRYAHMRCVLLRPPSLNGRSDSTEHSACAHSKDSEFPKIFSPCGAQNSRKFSALERRMRGGRYTLLRKKLNPEHDINRITCLVNYNIFIFQKHGKLMRNNVSTRRR